LTASQAL